MNRFLDRLKTLAAVVLITALGNSAAIAEDIEIYKKENLGAAGVKPNILFILDTSGSMGDLITLNENYDSLIDYSLRTGACFDNTRMYPVSDIASVTCTSSYTNNYFKMSQNQCAAAAIRFARDGLLDNTGIYTDLWAQWLDNKNIWVEPTNSSQDTYILECGYDQGKHGSGGVETYINVSGSVPHTTDSTNADTNWGNLSVPTQTMVSGNRMNHQVTAQGVEISKLDVMRNVITNLLYSVEGVNIGLMRFNESGEGGTILTEVRDVGLSRNDMYATMNTWNANGGTPLTEALYEGYRYYAGQPRHFGDTNTDGSALFVEGGTKYYKSPIDPDAAECQRQFIIMLSDGEPWGDESANSIIEGLPGFTGTDGSPGTCYGEGMEPYWQWEQVDGTWQWVLHWDTGDHDNGRCLDDLAKYMNDFGMDAYLGGGVTAEDVSITTYTVGFDASIDLLRKAGELGGGEYFEAYDSAGLLQTLISIINEIKGINTTFSSPAVSVNAFNRTTHRSDLYFTLFKPTEKPNWSGNIKRFKLTFDSSGIPEIVDVNGDPAINSATGFFRDTSHSYWTPTADAPDGQDTSKGGAASKLSNTRNVYSNISSSTTLSAASNRVIETNSANLTKDKLAIPFEDDAYYTNLVQWIRGIDVNDVDNDDVYTDARRLMGDPLHGQPALIQYGGTDADPEIVAYITTNEGYLHAIDTRINQGNEIFSFIPEELLPNLNSVYKGAGTSKTYGLDGSVIPWVKDDNLDGFISGTDKVYIYFGMRRGGNRTVDVSGNTKKVGSYYALDVTDRDNPVLMWKIDGGLLNGTQGDFTELAQTWSKPILKSIQIGGATRKVLVFGAGYDTNQDSYTLRTADDIGRGLFIVDALTGTRLWHAGPGTGADLILADLKYSVPSDVSAVDTTGDGLIDHIYVGDMGGQLWRFDVNNTKGATSSLMSEIMSGGRIADLADNTADSNRKFFYAPDAAIMQTSSNTSYIALVISSGNRSKPTGRDVQDRVFMIRDTPVHGAPTSYTTIVENNTQHDLFDTTDNVIGQGTQSQIDTATSALDASNGWYINFDLAEGEKGLSKPLIFGGEAYFTTYEPADPAVSTSACTPDEGDGFLYHIFVSDGVPVRNYDTVVVNSDDNLTKEDRVVTLARSGIPAEPRVIMPDGSNTAICVSTECDKMSLSGTHKKLYWYEK